MNMVSRRSADASRTRIKICCIASVDEARMAVGAGASALGLVSAMPSGSGPIPEELIADIVATIPADIASFLLTCATDASTIIDQQRRTRATTLQLVDAVPHEYPRLRDALPGIDLVQVIHVTGPESAKEAERVAPFVDAILLDSGNPNLAVKELGGTGRRHDWSISRRIVEEVDVPVWLAGGLNAANAREAIETVQPYGLDICSGVRTGGNLDAGKLTAFIGAVEGV